MKSFNMKVKKIIAGFYEIDTDCGHVFQAEKMSRVTGDAHDGWILSMKVPDIFGEFVFDDIRIEETLADCKVAAHCIALQTGFEK